MHVSTLTHNIYTLTHTEARTIQAREKSKYLEQSGFPRWANGGTGQYVV